MRKLCVVALCAALGLFGTVGAVPTAEARDAVRTGADEQRARRGTHAPRPRREGRAIEGRAISPGHGPGAHAAQAQRGKASYYGRAFNGRRMANGRP